MCQAGEFRNRWVILTRLYSCHLPQSYPVSFVETLVYFFFFAIFRELWPRAEMPSPKKLIKAVRTAFSIRALNCQNFDS